MIPILLAFAAFQNAAAATPGESPEAAEERRYRDCTAAVQSEPERAVERADAWWLAGGGLPARQCLGLAYVELGRWESAASVYDEAAGTAESEDDPQAADFRVQAANAWLAAGEPRRAIEALDAALATSHLTDELRGEAHLDRARGLVALDDPAAARRDLDRALQLVPADPLAWYLSAALARRQDDLIRARADIARAMELAPDNPDVVLLAGTLAGLAGDMAEAERLYRRVAEGAPGTEAGRAARESLATLREVEVPAPPPAPEGAPPAPPPQSR